MVILEMGLLKSIQDVYNIEEKIFNIEKFLDLINEFVLMNSDSLILKEIILSLLDLDGSKRRDPKEQLNLLNELIEEEKSKLDL